MLLSLYSIIILLWNGHDMQIYDFGPHEFRSYINYLVSST